MEEVLKIMILSDSEVANLPRQDLLEAEIPTCNKFTAANGYYGSCSSFDFGFEKKRFLRFVRGPWSLSQLQLWQKWRVSNVSTVIQNNQHEIQDKSANGLGLGLWLEASHIHKPKFVLSLSLSLWESSGNLKVHLETVEREYSCCVPFSTDRQKSKRRDFIFTPEPIPALKVSPDTITKE